MNFKQFFIETTNILIAGLDKTGQISFLVDGKKIHL
jgi:hypothetical protein